MSQPQLVTGPSRCGATGRWGNLVHLRATRHSTTPRPGALPDGRAPVAILERPSASAAAPALAGTAGVPTPAVPATPADAPSPLPTPTPIGFLSLSLVPFLWSTYGPCIRYLYAEPDALDPATLTAVRTALSAAALLLPALAGLLWDQGRRAWRHRQQQASLASSSSSSDSIDGDAACGSGASLGAALAAASDGAGDCVAVASAAAAVETGNSGSGSASSSVAAAAAAGSSGPLAGLLALDPPVNRARMGPLLTSTFSSVVWGGLELGVLNFMGTALQVEGLHSMTATRAGFLSEATAIFTPLVAYAAGYDIPRTMWLAVAIGLVGSTLVAYDSSQGHSDDAPTAAVASTAAAAASSTQAAPAASGAAVDAAAAAATASAAADASAAPLAAAAAAVADASSALGGADASAVHADLAASLSGTVVNAAPSAAAAIASSVLASAADAVADATPVAVEAAAAATVALGDAAQAGADALQAAASAAASAPVAADAAAALAVSAADAAAAAAAAASPLAVSGGEPLLLLSCLFFSICTVRMGIYSPRKDTMPLAAMKKVGLSGMALGWMAMTNLGNGASGGSAFTFPDLSGRPAVSNAVLFYSGLGPGALATFLQLYGLSSVPATTAQVIYSATPLLTAFIGWRFLGGEATGPIAWAGGLMIIAAACIAANAQQQQLQKR